MFRRELERALLGTLHIKPFAPGLNFAQNHVLKLAKLFSCHSLATYHKAVHRSYTSWPSDPDVMYICTSVQCWGMHRKQNFERVLGFKSDTAVLTFSFHFLSSPLLLLLLPHFFSSAKHLISFILVGNIFGKAFRIFGLDKRKGRWVVEKDFQRSFQVNVTWFFAFFSDLLETWSFWYGLKDHFTLHTLADKVVIDR